MVLDHPSQRGGKKSYLLHNIQIKHAADIPVFFFSLGLLGEKKSSSSPEIDGMVPFGLDYGGDFFVSFFEKREGSSILMRDGVVYS